MKKILCLNCERFNPRGDGYGCCIRESQPRGKYFTYWQESCTEYIPKEKTMRKCSRCKFFEPCDPEYGGGWCCRGNAKIYRHEIEYCICHEEVIWKYELPTQEYCCDPFRHFITTWRVKVDSLGGKLRWYLDFEEPRDHHKSIEYCLFCGRNVIPPIKK